MLLLDYMNNYVKSKRVQNVNELITTAGSPMQKHSMELLDIENPGYFRPYELTITTLHKNAFKRIDPSESGGVYPVSDKDVGSVCLCKPQTN